MPFTDRLALYANRLNADFPTAPHLGRNCTGGIIEIKSQPNNFAATVGQVYEDTVFEWNRTVVGRKEYGISQQWAETPQGFVYVPQLQPCANVPNQPLSEMPQGKPGFWAEVTVPYVDFVLENAQPYSPWLVNQVGYGLPTRLYYSQIVWIDAMKIGDTSGKIVYRVNEPYGNPGDVFWADASAFRPLTDDELTPIHPDVDPATKKIIVNLTYQTLSCFEDEREVFFCRISSGPKLEAGWETPPGDYNYPWRKTISIHMAGGTLGSGWDTPFISWTYLFAVGGIAIHSAFWHNDFGTARSHGCVNCRPDDAKWIFRWAYPHVSLDKSDFDLTGEKVQGTPVKVIERSF
jgi:hypothetical protein